MEIKTYFDQDTATVTRLIWNDRSTAAAIVDPVPDFDFETGRTSPRAIEVVLKHLKTLGLTLRYILETHAHAHTRVDHISAAAFVKKRCGGQTAIGVKNIGDSEGV